MAKHEQLVKVWDPFVRVAHWGLGLLVLGSFLTSEKDRLVHVHAKLGLAVAALVVLRVLWGFAGPRVARFRTFVKGPRETAAYAKALAAGEPPLHLSHNPLGGAMVVALLAVLAGLAATGLAVYLGPAFQGPLGGLLTKGGSKALKEVHEVLGGALLGLVGLHVAGVLFSSWKEKQNLVLGMVTGLKRDPAAAAPARRPDDPVALPADLFAELTPARAPVRGRAARAAVGAGLALALAAPAVASAAGPVAEALLRDYAAQARKERPTFEQFGAEPGRRIYTQTHVQDGAPVSCATCHTADPRARGRTPAGQVVEPLSPSVNPARFTDKADVEKWFKRNCKQVLGRECTAEEKGHLLTYFLQA